MSDATADVLAEVTGKARSRVAAARKPDATLLESSWPLVRLGEGLAALAGALSLAAAGSSIPALPRDVLEGTTDDLGHWMDWASERLSLEVEQVEASVADLADLLRIAAPAIIRVRTRTTPAFVLVMARRGHALQVLGPDLRRRTLRLETLRDQMTAPHEAPLNRELDRLLDAAAVAPRRRVAVRSAMARERLGATPIDGVWLLRLPPSRPFAEQLRALRLPGRLVLSALVFAVLYGLEILAWGVIGGSILAGRLDFGWLAAWSLLLLSMVPLRGLGSWINARLAVDFGRLLKSRLLLGALRVDPEAVRRQGAGHLLARVMESQAFEALAVAGGMSALVAVIELGFSLWLLASGAGGVVHAALLIGWTGLAIALGSVFFRRLSAWTNSRLDLTHGLIERLVGHRTILAQEQPSRRVEADREMSAYLQTSTAVDKAALPFLVAVPAGWMAVGVAGLAPAFIAGTAGAGAMAVALGGVLFATRALGSVTASLAALGRAAIAWREIAPMFKAASERLAPGPLLARTAMRPGDRAGGPLIEASGLGFGYPHRPILKGANLTIAHGERLLLEGRSGGGKSTLASLLVGTRNPHSGALLLNGQDRRTLGDAWHQFATQAPQFHENHILSGSLGFNLLLGRRWPATAEDLAEARAVCEELGLSDLLERMPGGLNQMIGETGWQLSHGERSRIYLARALLQDAELTILDESFAALDPEILQLCLDCAFRRAHTLLVIAHP